ncbi:LysE family translocator [Algirhabdus cladophorae]|uniref:LysE family translocator n=1 Tax=Algirhabdus cladophorae TaxID=3377108 RepID=UPI003B84935F
MTYLDTFSYFATILAVAVAPGPVVLMLMVRAASNDTKGAIGFATGYALGGVLILSAVCFGLGAWLTAMPEIFEYSKYIMLAYLLWLAYGIWRGGFDMTSNCATPRATSIKAVFAGTTTCFISPYMMVLLPLMLPGIVDMDTLDTPRFVALSAVTFLGITVGSGLVIGFSAQLRRLVRRPEHMVRMNRILAGILAVGGGVMAFT